MSPTTTASVAKNPSSFWQEDMLGFNPETGAWFVTARFENTIVYGTPMDVLYGKNLFQPSMAGAQSVATNLRAIAKLRPVDADQAQQAFEDAYAALRARRRFKTLRAMDYKHLFAELRQELRELTPSALALVWLRATYYLNVSRSNANEGRGGSTELQQIENEAFSAFSHLMREVYGSKAEQPLRDLVSAFAMKGFKKRKSSDVENQEVDQSEEQAIILPFPLTRADVALDKMPKQPAASGKIKPADPVKDIPRANLKPEKADIQLAFAAVPDNEILQSAAETMDRGTFLATLNTFLPPEKRRSLVDLSEVLGVSVDEGRDYVIKARNFVEAAQREKTEKTEAAFAAQQKAKDTTATTGTTRAAVIRRPAPNKKAAPKKPAADAGDSERHDTPADAFKVAARDLQPIESIDLGQLTIDLYDRPRQPCTIRGTDVHMPRASYTILKILVAQGGQSVPYAVLQKAFPSSSAAMVANALSHIEDAYQQVRKDTDPANILTRQKGDGVTLAVLPQPSVDSEPADTPVEEQPTPQPAKAKTSFKAAAKNNTPVESVTIGGLVIDHYDRRHAAYMVQGTQFVIPPKVFQVLQMLSEADGAFVPHSRLRGPFAQAASAGILTSSALTTLASLFYAPAIQEMATVTFERDSKQGARLVAKPEPQEVIKRIGPYQLPERMDLGYLALAYDPEAAKPVTITGSNLVLSERAYRVLVHITEAQTPMAARQMSHIFGGQTPEASVFAAIAKLREVITGIAGINGKDVIVISEGKYHFVPKAGQPKAP